MGLTNRDTNLNGDDNRFASNMPTEHDVCNSSDHGRTQASQ